MKRFWKLLLALFLVVAFALPAQAEMRKMWAQAYKWEGGMDADGTMTLTKLNDSVRFWVQAVSADTLETLYEYDDPSNTSLDNPITVANFEDATVCNGLIAFNVDPTDANDKAVDLYVVMQDGGFFVFVEDFDENQHTIVIDARPGVEHHGIYRTAVISSTTEVDTEVDFSYDTVVRAVTVEIITEDAGTTVDIGIDTSAAGDVDGFVDGISLATAGFVDNTLTTVGEYLDDASDADIVGYPIDGTDEQTMCYAGESTTNNTGVIMIHYWFTRLR